MNRMIPKVIRLPDVMQLTGLGATTIWRRERDGVFPPRFPLGGRAVGWLYADVMAWLEKLATQGAYQREMVPCKAIDRLSLDSRRANAL